MAYFGLLIHRLAVLCLYRKFKISILDGIDVY